MKVERKVRTFSKKQTKSLITFEFPFISNFFFTLNPFAQQKQSSNKLFFLIFRKFFASSLIYVSIQFYLKEITGMRMFF